MNKLSIRKIKEFDNHKSVIKIEDKESGLIGFIAIHNNNLGSPAVGGTRMIPYKSEKEALKDVLRLSKAMTYKCAMARVPYGGAKGVIIGNPKKDKTEKLLVAYARKVDSLKGEFCTGEDVGITEDDINIMLEVSDYFIGKPNLAGSPSYYAALSTFYSIQSAVSYLYKKKSLKGMSFAVKGVGKVGKELVGLLHRSNVEVYISDVDKEAVNETKRKFPEVKITDNKKINKLPVDVYTPCALGNEFSMKNAHKIKAKIICGAANNQLSDHKVGDWFFKNNITYIPDYVANSGGLINVVDELSRDGYKREHVLKRIKRIKNTVKKILVLSSKENRSPHRVADKIAESYFSG